MGLQTTAARPYRLFRHTFAHSTRFCSPDFKAQSTSAQAFLLSRAQRANSVRLCRPVLPSILLTWLSIVRWLTFITSAIWRFAIPCASNCTTFNSVGVNSTLRRALIFGPLSIPGFEWPNQAGCCFQRRFYLGYQFFWFKRLDYINVSPSAQAFYPV